MKVLLPLLFITVIGTASAGLLHHPLATVIPGAVVHSSSVGGGFAYSTVEGPVVAAPHHGLLGHLHHGVVAPGLLHHGALAHGLHHGLHHGIPLGIVHG